MAKAMEVLSKPEWQAMGRVFLTKDGLMMRRPWMVESCLVTRSFGQAKEWVSSQGRESPDQIQHRTSDSYSASSPDEAKRNPGSPLIPKLPKNSRIPLCYIRATLFE